jgi:hypothetical protein
MVAPRVAGSKSGVHNADARVEPLRAPELQAGTSVAVTALEYPCERTLDVQESRPCTSTRVRQATPSLPSAGRHPVTIASAIRPRVARTAHLVGESSGGAVGLDPFVHRTVTMLNRARDALNPRWYLEVYHHDADSPGWTADRNRQHSRAEQSRGNLIRLMFPRFCRTNGARSTRSQADEGRPTIQACASNITGWLTAVSRVTNSTFTHSTHGLDPTTCLGCTFGQAAKLSHRVWATDQGRSRPS